MIYGPKTVLPITAMLHVSIVYLAWTNSVASVTVAYKLSCIRCQKVLCLCPFYH